MTLTSKTPIFQSRFITPELTRLFSQSDSEEEFEGFSEDEDFSRENKDLQIMESEEESDTNFYSDEEPPSPKRKSLLVALRFPFKSPSTIKQQALKKKGQKDKESHPLHKKQKVPEQKMDDEDTDDDEEEVLSQSLKKRNKNIQENKAMLAKLFADLSTMAVLTPPSTPQKKKKNTRKRKA